MKGSKGNLQWGKGRVEGTEGGFWKCRWDNPRKSFRVLKNKILKKICCKIIFIFKFTNPIMQEIESWVEEEQVGLSIGQETSDEVSLTPLNFFKKILIC